MNRRFFLKSGSIALASIGMSLSAPSFLERVVLGNAVTGGKRKTLIAIFQRGAVDGLNMVVPFGESSYYDFASVHRDPETGIGQCRGGDRSRWFLWTASVDEFVQAALGFEAAGDRSRVRIARQHSFALRCAGLHGVGDAGSEVDERWLAESLSAKQDRIRSSRLFRAVSMTQNNAARASGTRAGGGDVESRRLRDSRRQVVGKCARWL